MHVRCPHCHNPMEVVEETSLAELTCDSCNSIFSLIGEEPTCTYDGAGPLQDYRDIAQFRLLEVLGVGAFGTVWKAKDTDLDRTVAVKIPRRGQLGAREAENFLREARAAAQLQHANIVSVHEVGRHEDTVYIVSDYVKGVTLADLLTARRLSARESAKLCVKIAGALHHAHEAGVIHRDLKPANIMLDSKHEPFVMDFGVAKREAAEITMTVEGRVLGTPAYMSPEQAEGEAHNVDRRSDVYSLGVVLYELLSGERPFRGNARMLLQQVIHEEPPSPRRLNSNISRDLETICLKCLEKQPARRYATALEVAEELERYLRRQPILARPVSTPERCWRWCHRNPTVAGLLGLITVMLVSSAVVATVAAFRFRNLADRAKSEAARANEASNMERLARADETKARQQLELTLGDTYTSFGLLAGDTTESAQAALWFANAADPVRDDPQRSRFNQIRFQNWIRRLSIPVRVFGHGGVRITEVEWHAGGEQLLTRTIDNQSVLWNIDAQTKMDLPGAEGRIVEHATWSPDGSRLAVVWQGEKGVEVLETPSGKRQHLVPFEEAVSVLAFAADGQRLAIAGKAVKIWDCRDGEFAVDGLVHPEPVVHVVFGQQGTRLATACQDGLARVFDISSPAASREPLFDPVLNVEREGGVRASIPPAFVDQDKGLVTATAKSEVTCWNTRTGETQYALSVEGPVFRVVPATDSTNFVVCGFEIAQLYDAQSGEPVGDAMTHGNFVYHAAFSPDGALLATASADRKARLWHIPSGKPFGAVVPHQDEVLWVRFSDDGRAFVTAQRDGVVRIWTQPVRHEHHHHVVLPTDQVFVALSSDGRHFVPSGWDRTRALRSLQVYDVATGLESGPALSLAGLLNGAEFSPDGKTVVALCASPDVEPGVPSAEQLRSQTGIVAFYSRRTGQQVGDSLTAPSEPIGVSFHPDGATVAVVCAAGEVLLVEAATNKLSRQLEQGAAAVPGFVVNRRVRFSPDGSSLLTWGTDRRIRVFDPRSGELKYELEHPGSYLTYNVDFSSDGKWLATCATSGEMTTAIWDVATGKLETSIDHPDWVFHAKFGPGTKGDRHLLTVCRDGMARLWLWREQKLVCPALVHTDTVFDGVFLPQDGLIMTTSRDGFVRIWESLTGKAVTPRFKVPGRAYQVAVTGDGKHAIVAGSKNTLHLFALEAFVHGHYAAATPEMMRQLCELISGQTVHPGGGAVNLTSQQWLDRWEAFRTRHGQFLSDVYTP